jgi:hypothetical protein
MTLRFHKLSLRRVPATSGVSPVKSA